MKSESSKKIIGLGILAKLKLRAKIFLGFSLILAILGASSLFGYLNFVKIGHDLDSYAENVEEASISSAIEAQFLTLEMYAREYAVSGDEALAGKARAVIAELGKRIAKGFDHVKDPADLDRLKEIQAASSRYAEDFEKAVKLEEELKALVDGKLHPSGEKFLADVEELVEHAASEGNREAGTFAEAALRHALSARLHSNIGLGVEDEAAIEKARHEFAEIQSALAGLEKSVKTDRDRVLQQEMAGLLETYRQAFELAVKDKHALSELVHGDMEVQAQTLLGGVTALRQKMAEAEARVRQKTDEEIRLAETSLLIAGVAGVALGIVLSVLIGSLLANPIVAMTAAMRRLADGDLEADIPAQTRKDEIGEMSQAVQVFKENAIRNKQLEAEQENQKQRAAEEKRKMMNKLADDFDANVGGIVDTVSSASAQLQAAAQSMAGIAEETSTQASAVAAASQQASGNVQTVASATEEMSNSIKDINGQILETSEISRKAAADVSTTASQMETLARTADKIGEVISLISDIAEQTNLLALNATIESARAGEAGRGFAVVAGEVKALANETAKATEGISKLIEEIQSETKTAVTAIEGIGSVISKLEETSAAVAAAMDQQAAATQDVARNVTEAASGTSEVTSNIAGVTQASQEAGAASGQVMTAAQDLSGQASTLKSAVTKFLEEVRAA